MSATHERTRPESENLLQEAIALFQSGQAALAQEKCKDLLLFNPQHPGAWHFLGVLSLSENDYASAHSHISRAIALCDTKPVYFNNFGVASLELGRHAEAEAAFRQAVALNANYADAWSNLGRVQHLLHGSLEEAEQSLLNALLLKQDHPEALLHLADVHRLQGRLDDSARVCEQFIARWGGQSEARKKHGQTLTLLGRFEEARAAFEQGIELAPNDSDLHYSLGMLFAQRERIDEAKQAFRRAARCRPGKDIWRWKHLGICPSAFPDEHSIERYWTRLDDELREALSEEIVMDWQTLAYDGFTPSFNLPHHNRCCREVKEKFARLFKPAFPHEPPRIRKGAGTERPAKVGFLVTAGHENGFLRGMARVVEKLDPERFEPVLFCTQASVQRMRRAVRRSEISVVPLLARFEKTAEAVREAACDAMYFWKVGADTWNHFLPMARLAPIQCTSWGTHGTSGVDCIDYYLSSEWMESDSAEVDASSHYTERLCLLPTFPTWQQRQAWRQPCTRDDFGLPSQGAVYLCPHRLPKYHPAFDAYLRDILERDPAGCVVLLCGRPSPGQALLQERIGRNLGAALCRQVRFLATMHVEEYYQVLSLATVVLDSPVYAGGITAYDAFSYDIPVVTQAGPLAVQNYTAGLYRRMGIADLTARDREEYVGIAVRLGLDADCRQDTSDRLSQQSDAIFDDPEVVPAFEQCFLDAIRFAEDGLSTAPFSSTGVSR